MFAEHIGEGGQEEDVQGNLFISSLDIWLKEVPSVLQTGRSLEDRLVLQTQMEKKGSSQASCLHWPGLLCVKAQFTYCV